MFSYLSLVHEDVFSSSFEELYHLDQKLLLSRHEDIVMRAVSRDALAPEASRPNYNVSIFFLLTSSSARGGEISIRRAATPQVQILVTALLRVYSS